MAYTIACFCGTIFGARHHACPTCGRRVPRVLLRATPDAPHERSADARDVGHAR